MYKCLQIRNTSGELSMNNKHQMEFTFDYTKSVNPEKVESNGDRNILCRDCRRIFLWTREQQEVDVKFVYSQPEYCDNCRLKSQNRKRKK